MAQVVVRGIADATMASFRRRAEAQGKSTEQAIRDLIEEAAREHEAWGAFVRRARKLRKRLKASGYTAGDAVASVREDRDR